MACATLKRNLDWESMAQMPAKRRRCAPFTASSSTSPGLKVSETKSCVFGETVTAPAKLTPERMAQEICDEITRLHRRRQLRLASGAAASCSSSSGSEGDTSPPQRSHSRKKVQHRALFTFKQVRIICERLLRDQEAALRAEYEVALNNKLAEQYEAFVRFNIDQKITTNTVATNVRLADHTFRNAFVTHSPAYSPKSSVQRRPPPNTCMPLGMDAEHHMHQDLVPSYLS